MLLLPMGQCEPVCQVKNANELFRHMLHMINVAQECAYLVLLLLLLGTIRGSQCGVAPPAKGLPASASPVEHARFW